MPRPAPTPEKMTTAQAVAEIQPDPTDLDTQVEALVRRHTCGAVIDAAWAAASRIFRPNGRTA